MTQTLVFQFSLDPAETVRASRFIQRRGWFGWVSRAVWPFFVLLTILYLISGASLQELWRLGLVAIILATLGFGVPILQRWKLRRAYTNTPNLRGPQTYQLSDAGLQITGGAATVSLGWESFVEATETDEVFLLFYSKRCAYYLPKRAVPSSAQMQAVRELLQKHLASRRGAYAPPVRQRPHRYTIEVMLVLRTWLLAASIVAPRQDTTIVAADIDGDGSPEAFVSIAPSVRQTPTILVYKYDRQHGAHRLFEGLVPGELQPVSGRFFDDHTMGFGIDMSVDEGGHPGAFDKILAAAVTNRMSLVRYSTFLHADGRKAFLSFVDLSDRALPTPGTKTCENFEFGPVDGLATGTLSGSGGTRYLVALTTNDVTIYLFRGIRANETLEKTTWIRPRPARATTLKVLASGEVQIGMPDGRSEPLAAPR